jgi:HSF-type DNA-binding
MTTIPFNKTTVEHSYEDHYHASESKAPGAVAEQQAQRRVLMATGHRSDRNFPVKLHCMLSALEKEGLSHIVSWQPHGRCFLVRDHKKFVERILPL